MSNYGCIAMLSYYGHLQGMPGPSGTISARRQQNEGASLAAFSKLNMSKRANSTHFKFLEPGLAALAWVETHIQLGQEGFVVACCRSCSVQPRAKGTQESSPDSNKTQAV
jgi:hypothetical protein